MTVERARQTYRDVCNHTSRMPRITPISGVCSKNTRLDILNLEIRYLIVASEVYWTCFYHTVNYRVVKLIQAPLEVLSRLY